MDVASVVISAPNIERVTAFETEHDSILIVHADGVRASQLTSERVQPVPGWHLQIVKLGHGVDLIEFPTHDWPELTRNPPRSFAVDAVPDVLGGVIRQRPDHE